MEKELTSSVRKRIAELMRGMTLEEKVSQVVYDSPGIERLGITPYNWWNECLHGVGRAGVATVFPQAIGLAATWNRALVHEVATVISDEARAKHHEAARRGIRQIYTGLTFWSPNINIFRDPRWGRGQETYGEDPYLTACMGVAFVRGLQGDDPRYLKVVATPKHYAAHSGPESERHHFNAEVGERDLRETYLPAFEACVRVGQAASVMGAYNRVNGEACCASRTLLEDTLRQEWGFEGYIVSDCGAILDIYAHHRIVDTPAEAAAVAVKAGCDLNCGKVYLALLDAVRQGLITELVVDQAVERLLAARFRLGMFDPPEQVRYAQIPYEVVDSPQYRELALRAARESIVLLKNADNLLPLAKDLASIAVIGPNANDLQVLLGNYSGTPMEATTPLEGIRKKVSPSTKIYSADGCAWADGIHRMEAIPSAHLRPADSTTEECGLAAEYYDHPGFEGQPVLRRIDPTIDFTWKDTTPLTGLWGDAFAVRWTGRLVPPKSGSYQLGVRGFSAYKLYLDGELIAEYEGLHHPILSSKQVDLQAGQACALRLEYVSRWLAPQVQLLWALPDPKYEDAALEAAKKSDVIIAVMGVSPALEGEEMPVEIDGFSGGDRTKIGLPRPQETLLRRLHALGKPLVLVLLNGSVLAIDWAAKHVPAVVEAWYPGQAGGDALADVLFGDYNPGGRLPVTCYRSIEDLPPFDDYAMEGRTYRYFRGTPLFPFGYGLSYTTFELDNLHVDRCTIQAGGQIAVSCDVANTGERSGDEVVQLYVRHRNATVPRPVKELKGFARVTLQPGECKTVTFTLHSSQLAFHDETMRLMIQPGTVEILLGNSSAHLPLVTAIEIVGQPAEVGADRVFFSEARTLDPSPSASTLR
jgi:beta-glucosidase